MKPPGCNVSLVIYKVAFCVLSVRYNENHCKIAKSEKNIVLDSLKMKYAAIVVAVVVVVVATA